MAQRSRLAVTFFTWVMQRQIAREFHALRLAGNGPPDLPTDRPVVVYSNHPAWWDPALFIVLAGRLFADRQSFGPMDSAALSQYRVLRRVGIFGIETEGYRGAARLLRIARGVLAAPSRMLWVTAQGEFVDPRIRPVRLRPGLARVLARVPQAIAVPLAIEYVFWQEKQPEALCRFGAPITGNARTTEQLAAALTETIDSLGQASMTRDASGFTTLVSGRVGVGGLYDLGRRLQAAARGRVFDARHDRQPPR
ncbi:acyltransferase [Salinisphaera sp. Q1T1-3]|nr:acyltransferase [Salinisphaera sp. Q1T1-3]